MEPIWTADTKPSPIEHAERHWQVFLVVLPSCISKMNVGVAEAVKDALIITDEAMRQYRVPEEPKP